MSTQGSVKRDASGRWFYVVDVTADGGKRKQLRKRGFATKSKAQEELVKVLRDLQRDSFVRPSRIQLADYLRSWLAALPASGRRPSTIAGYRIIMEHHVIPALGAIELQALRATDLDRLYARLLDGERAMSTVRKVHIVLGKALADAERKELIVRNVARLATPPNASASRAPEMKSGRRRNSGRSSPRSPTIRITPCFGRLQ